MKKIYILFFVAISFFFSIQHTYAVETIPMQSGGLARQYLKFIPAGQSQPTSIILLLPGLNSTAAEFAALTNSQNMANRLNAVILVPEAIGEQNEDIKNLMTFAGNMNVGIPAISLDHIWNAGVSVDVSGVIPGNMMEMVNTMFPTAITDGKIVLNANVDDVSFLNAIIDKEKVVYSLDAADIFMVGASMGGAMTYNYVYSTDTQLGGIAVIAGFVGAEVNSNKALGFPVCIFHSTTDEVVLFNGGMFNATPVVDVVNNIVSKKDCTEVDVVDFENIADDGITIQCTKYDCDEDQKVFFYKITGAAHATVLTSNYKTGPNDIDYMLEVSRFFYGEDISLGNSVINKQHVAIYPNPVTEAFALSVEGTYKVKDMTGKVLLTGKALQDEYVYVNHLPTGIYLIEINAGEITLTDKFIIQ